jgi:hypothetical protein
MKKNIGARFTPKNMVSALCAAIHYRGDHDEKTFQALYPPFFQAPRSARFFTSK